MRKKRTVWTPYGHPVDTFADTFVDTFVDTLRPRGLCPHTPTKTMGLCPTTPQGHHALDLIYKSIRFCREE